MQKYGMATRGSILIGLSGGADSMALLHALLELKEEMGCSLFACHVNHGLRGEESDSDELFVRSVCHRLRIPLKVFKADVKGEALRTGKSTEEAARDLRYACFQEACAELRCEAIATAHTLNDSMETVLFHMARGTGIDGLTGIPPLRDNIMRPLIDRTREEVEEYCESSKISFVVDSTNLDETYSRNKIRHRVLPALKEINPGFYGSMRGMMDSLKQDALFLSRLSDRYVNELGEEAYIVQNLLAIEPALRRRVVEKFVEKYGLLFDRKKFILIEYMIKEGKGAVSLSGGCSLRIKNGALFVEPPKAPPCRYTGTLQLGEENRFGAWSTVYANRVPRSSVPAGLVKDAFDPEQTVGPLQLRSRLEGDQVRLAGRGVTKSLKKLFNEAKIDPGERDRIPIIADDLGIIWIDGFGVSERAAVGDRTREVVYITVEVNNQ